MLIKTLVGHAVANVTLNRVEEFVQEPSAPNLYWALTDLPRPLIDLRRPLQGERIVVDGLLPEIREALKDPRAPPVAVAQLTKRIERLAILGSPWQNRTALLFHVARRYPAAREYFLRQGRNALDLDAMPVTQVVLMHELALYDVWADELSKLNNLPYWEFQPRAKALKQAFQRELAEHSGEMHLPIWARGSENVFATRARTDRRIALLRCVEAIRLYAAEQGERLPTSLQDIREVPIPIDPMTGQAFLYRIEKGRAILETRPVDGGEATHSHAVRIEIQLAAKGK